MRMRMRSEMAILQALANSSKQLQADDSRRLRHHQSTDLIGVFEVSANVDKYCQTRLSASFLFGYSGRVHYALRLGSESECIDAM